MALAVPNAVPLKVEVEKGPSSDSGSFRANDAFELSKEALSLVLVTPPPAIMPPYFVWNPPAATGTLKLISLNLTASWPAAPDAHLVPNCTTL
jgi:hypothetical protein